jgi:hypothetical protein
MAVPVGSHLQLRFALWAMYPTMYRIATERTTWRAVVPGDSECAMSVAAHIEPTIIMLALPICTFTLGC